MGEAEAWYQRYFGADYLRIYRLADTAEQLEFLATQTAALPRGSRLLDLPCGHGRHAVELARWDLRVAGADLNPTFLARAAHSAAEAGVRLDLARADMRWFPYADESFDAAICMFTSLGYFDSDEQHARVLAEFARVLVPGGLFILDLANIDAVRSQPAESAWEREGVRVASQYAWREADKRALTTRQVRFPDGREERYASSVRLFEGAEIERLLAAAGLRVRRVLGAYRGGDVTPEQPRRILCCEREAGA